MHAYTYDWEKFAIHKISNNSVNSGLNNIIDRFENCLAKDYPSELIFSDIIISWAGEVRVKVLKCISRIQLNGSGDQNTQKMSRSMSRFVLGEFGEFVFGEDNYLVNNFYVPTKLSSLFIKAKQKPTKLSYLFTIAINFFDNI
ncbi:hypothetical protein BpHYR1_032941 [Brachionus plicatilis]|uniref:Uncharacterized protein n=1 Tax=Brachionus plicatilis TaxID=10195 RepID=A0A3M7RQF1_BRAPC|nr:hypothetical protein BpHYR1_032941 [Brachionus plicatilis]